MSVVALPIGAVGPHCGIAPQARVWPRLPLKRIVQFTLIAIVVLPIPSDDGPVRPRAAASTMYEACSHMPPAHLSPLQHPH